MQNVLKRKNVFGRISGYFEFFLSKSYVLNHSESIDMHIEKLFLRNLFFCRFLQKADCCPTGGGGGGGSERYGHVRKC